jgi:hypothetical protein
LVSVDYLSQNPVRGFHMNFLQETSGVLCLVGSDPHLKIHHIVPATAER